jgi:hypothetical protein
MLGFRSFPSLVQSTSSPFPMDQRIITMKYAPRLSKQSWIHFYKVEWDASMCMEMELSYIYA